jgi:dolichyl-phosphate-mannose-protein mannosyltransferase
MTHRYNLRKRKLAVFPGSSFSAFSDGNEYPGPDENDEIGTYAGYGNVTDDFLLHDEPPRKKMVLASGSRSFSDKSLVIALTVASLATRLYSVNLSSIVVWDEAHFGKFANYYLKRTFYFDVHPPLGKMLIAFSGWLFSYKGSFAFESGSKYADEVPIAAMRAFCCIFGALTVPLMFLIVRNLQMRKETALFVASMALFDNAIVAISKFVLLDSILLFFTTLSLFFATKISQHETKPFGGRFFFFLAATGFSLGLVLSVKWVGLFTFAFVGVMTIADLWSLLRIAKREPVTWGKHFLVRAFFLICVPLIVYMATFKLHFTILKNSGPGDAQMSSLFQSRLVGSKVQNVSRPVTWDGITTLRNNGHGGGLLHSHVQGYPEGSKQQQVTIYHHSDHNNNWKMLRPWERKGSSREQKGSSSSKKKNDLLVEDASDIFIYDSQVFRLSHVATNRNLHTHPLAAPITVDDYEVSCYGNATTGDEKDHWQIEIISGGMPTVRGVPIVKSLSTRFRIRHVLLGCYLGTTGEHLPEWGFKQMEVVCTKEKNSRTVWNIESGGILDDFFDEKLVPSTFLQDFLDLNVAMWHGNNGLKPKTGKKDLLTSKPHQWPTLEIGLRMCNWNDNTLKFYLIGNPIVWWTAVFSILFFYLEISVIYIRKKITTFISFTDEQYANRGMILTIGWALHYIPFYLMGRVTYLHHVFPSLLVSFLTTGLVVERHVKGRFVVGLAVAIFCGTFLFFSPLTYGFTGKNELMAGRRWREKWNI